MKPFDKRFFTILEKKASAPIEPDLNLDVTTDESDIDAENDALGSMLDNPKTVDKLKTSMATRTNVVDDTDAKKNAETVTMREKLLEWVEVLESFGEFLNGNDEHSINAMLAKAATDSLFDKIKKSEGKRIGRAAIDISGLKEALKTYVVSNQ